MQNSTGENELFNLFESEKFSLIRVKDLENYLESMGFKKDESIPRFFNLKGKIFFSYSIKNKTNINLIGPENFVEKILTGSAGKIEEYKETKNYINFLKQEIRQRLCLSQMTINYYFLRMN